MKSHARSVSCYASTQHALLSLREEVERLLVSHRRTTPGLADEYERRSKELDRELGELARAISQIKHQRPILDRIDAVEVERNEVANKLSGMRIEVKKNTMMPVTEQAMRAFVESLRDDLQLGDMKRRKALLKQLTAYRKNRFVGRSF
jgi:hypothetical protein